MKQYSIKFKISLTKINYIVNSLSNIGILYEKGNNGVFF